MKYKKSNTPKNNREHQEQARLLQWIAYYPLIAPYLIAIPNGGYRSITEAKRLKAEGVRAGVSDLFLALPNDDYSGLWIELKAKQANGYYARPTQQQLNWLTLMKQAGYDGLVAQGMEQAKNKIIEYIRHSDYRRLFSV